MFKILWVEEERSKRAFWRRFVQKCDGTVAFEKDVQRASRRFLREKGWTLIILPCTYIDEEAGDWFQSIAGDDLDGRRIVLCEEEREDIEDFAIEAGALCWTKGILKEELSGRFVERNAAAGVANSMDALEAVREDNIIIENTSERRIFWLEKELKEVKHSLSILVDERTKQLEQAKREWEQTFDAINDPVLIIDENYQIVRANIALSVVVGKDIRKLIGGRCHKELMRSDEVCENCPLKETLEEESGKEAEIRQAGGEALYHLRSFPLSGQMHVVHEYRDITEEKAIQQMLVQADKMSSIGMLAGRVAHEINNPLAAILAQTQLLLMDFCSEDSQHASLKDVEKAALRCRKIVQDLLNFSRQKVTDRRTRHDLLQILEQTLEIYDLVPPKDGPRTIVNIEPNLPLLHVDPDKLKSVFLNLLSNAKAATPPDGKVELHVALKENHGKKEIEIVVRDTGQGIPTAIQEKIFMPFFTTKAPGLGTGLGLYIVGELVKEHEGRLEVESIEGKGSVFKVFLPT